MTAPSAGAVASDSSFEGFYQREHARVLALAYVLSGSKWAAEDLVQDAFMAAFRKWNRIGNYARPGAWVRQVVANQSVSVIRRRYAEARAVARLAAGSRPVLDGLPEPTAEFWSTVRSLPRRQAQALALFYLEDRPTAEIAEILKCSEATARVHLHQGRRSLAGRLDTEVES